MGGCSQKGHPVHHYTIHIIDHQGKENNKKGREEGSCTIYTTALDCISLTREEEQEKEEGEEEELSFLTFQNGDCLEEDQVTLHPPCTQQYSLHNAHSSHAAHACVMS